MASDQSIWFRSATPDDDAFIVEMARHACVIEDWPLPDGDSEEVVSLLPTAGTQAIVAVGEAGARIGAVWTFQNDPPLLVDSAGVPVPEFCIAVVPRSRGRGVGGALLERLLLRGESMPALSANVHVRNPARTLYERKGFGVVGPGRGALGVAMYKRL